MTSDSKPPDSGWDPTMTFDGEAGAGGTPDSGVTDPLQSWHLGPYRLTRLLGLGGTGRVYEVVDEDKGAKLALKILAHLTPRSLLRFKREFRMLTDISHHNLVRLYELAMADDTWFLTMELVQGRDFRRFVWNGDTPVSHFCEESEVRLRQALKQLATGLMALHREDLLHLDLKPSNVLVESSGRVVVLDFGLARLWGGEDVEQWYRRAGSPHYISPEQVQRGPTSPASDWYAVGVILFEVLTGALPFHGTAAEVMRLRCEVAAPSPLSVRADIPKDIGQLCTRLLQRDPSKRPSGAEILSTLGETPGASHAARPDRCFVGRGNELAQMLDAYEQTRDNSGILLTLQGHSGIGKSTLLRRFLKATRKAGAFVLHGRCHEWESLPYKGFDALFDWLARWLYTVPEVERWRVLGKDGRYAAEMFPVLYSLPDLSREDAGSDGEVEPNEKRRRAFLSLRRILERLARNRPLVVVLEDVQWAGVDSARLLLEMLLPDSIQNSLTVCSYRTDEAPSSAFLREVEASLDVSSSSVRRVTMDLGPLSFEEGVELALDRLALSAGGELSAKIAREAEGNPYFIEELARYASSSTLNRSILDNRDPVGALLVNRFQRLSEPERRLLEILSVAGRPMTQAVVLKAARIDAGTPGTLARLRAESLIRTGGFGLEDRIEVYHDRLRSSLMGSLSQEHRRALHLDLARTLEASVTTEPDVLAFHYHGAGDLSNAAELSERAAIRAESKLAFERAAGLYGNAIEWGRPGSDKRRELLRRRANALSNVGKTGEAAGIYRELAQETDGPEHLELLRHALEAYLVSQRVNEGMEVLESIARVMGVRLARSAGPVSLSIVAGFLRLKLRGLDFEPRSEESLKPRELDRVDLFWSLGKGLSNIMPLHGIDFMLRSLREALELGEPVRVGRVLAVMGIGLAMQGGRSTHRAEDFLDRAARIADTSGSSYLRGLTGYGRAGNDLVNGRWREAIKHMEQSLAFLQSDCVGAFWERTMGCGLVLKALENIGEMKELGEQAARLGKEAAERGDLYGQGAAAYFGALSCLAADDMDRARSQAHLAAAPLTSHAYTVQHFYLMLLEALFDLYAGSPEVALGRLNRERSRFRRAGLMRVSLSRVDILLLRSRILLNLESRGAGQERRLLRSCEKIAYRLSKATRRDCGPHAATIRAAVAWRRRQKTVALDCLRQAEESYGVAEAELARCFVQRQIALLSNGEQTTAQVEARINQLGVRNSELWARIQIPGFDSISALERQTNT